MGDLESAIEKFTEADAILSRNPASRSRGVILRHWADALKQSGDLPAATEKYRAAETILLSFAPPDLPTLVHLSEIADKIAEMGDEQHAMQLKRATNQLFEELFPESVEFAKSLSSAATLCEQAGDNATAMQLMERADCIYALRRDRNCADHLRQWSLLLAKVGSKAEAQEKLRSALAMFSEFKDKEQVIACLELVKNLG